MLKELIDKMIAILDKKQHEFHKIYDITKKQKEDLDQNNGDSLTKLVQEKQKHIDRVDELDSNFSECFELLKKELDIESIDSIDIKQYPEFNIIKNKISGIISLAKDIMEIESYNNKKAEEIFSTIKSELKKIKQGKATMKAYQMPTLYTDGIYIDKKK